VTAGALLWLAAWLAAAFPAETLTVASARGERKLAVRTERGWPAVAAPELVAALSVATVEGPGGAWSVSAAGRRFDFVLEASYFRLDNRLFALASPPYVARDTLFVPLQWAIEFLPRLASDRFHYDPLRSRLEETPVAVDAAALPASPAAAPDTAARSSAAQAPSARPARSPARGSSGLRQVHVVALDAGHGGPDVGMLGPIRGRKFLREKDVALAVAKDVGDELRRRGVGVVMTRTTDTLIALRDRGRIARTQHADLFVSIHVNAANPRWRDAAGTRGFETYFLAEARTEDARRVAQLENESVRFEKGGGAGRDPMQFIFNDLQENEHLCESSRLAEIMERTLGQVHPAEARGVKQAGFAVLATSYMPAVLVELGFGSNPDEARFLTGAAGQRRLARGIADAVISYLAEYERRLASGSEGGGTR
jgi:N-acetylmuramoyl-L-alanine amidase